MTETAPRLAVRAPVYGASFMAVTGHMAGSVAALRAKERGGNVVDSAIAASAALAAVLGQATTIGGDCFVLYHEAKSGKVHALNASGVAPEAATPEVYADGMKVHGPLACVVPGLVRAWAELHGKFGQLSWRELLDDAIWIADGHPVSFILASRFADAYDELAADPGCSALYLSGGKPVALGDTLRQPALSRTLQLISEDGPQAFYEGEIASRIAAGFARAGGLMTTADLAAYKPMWVEPVSTVYRGHRVSVMPPNSCGGLLPMQLDGLSALTSDELTADAARCVGYQMSAMKAAFEHGRPLVSDPAAQPDAPARMMSDAMKALMREAVLAMKPGAAVPEKGGTACVLVADGSGDMICIVQSIYNVFGSTFLEPDTGILFNNRMQDFDHRPGHPNSVGPRRRPFHTLCPILVQDASGRPRFAMASPGGISQTLTASQVLTELLDRGRDVSAAVEAPRWCNRKSGDFLVEPSYPADIVERLGAMGHKARRAGDPYYFGSAKVIEWLPSGNLAGAGDHRREAYALGA